MGVVSTARDAACRKGLTYRLRLGFARNPKLGARAVPIGAMWGRDATRQRGRARALLLVALVGCGGGTRVVASRRHDGGLPVGPVRALAGAVGSAHPFVLVDQSARGRWVVLCQAREDTDRSGDIYVEPGPHGVTLGDRLDPYLVLGEGLGDPIDDLVASDPAGRWVAVVERGRLVLVDAENGRRTELSDAVVSRRGAAFDPPLDGSFDDAGRRFAYVRSHEGLRRVAVRDLASGHETIVRPGPGRLVAAELDASGSWVRLESVPRDTDRDGTLRARRPGTTLSAALCRGPASIYSSGYDRGGDDVETRWAPASGGRASAIRGAIGPIGSVLLVRRDDGALVARQADGRESEWAPASCDASVVQVSPRLDRVLVACGDDALWLVGPSGRESVAMERAHAPARRRRRARDRLLPQRLYWQAGERTTAVLDLQTGLVRIRSPIDDVVAVHDTRLVYYAGDRLLLWDHATERETALPVGRRTWSASTTGAFLLHAHAVYDLASVARTGRVEGAAMGLSADGRVLVATERGGRPIPIGPLRWEQPMPVVDDPQRPPER